MSDLDLHARQDEPYHGEFEWVDDGDVALSLPDGTLRMHIRADVSSRRILLDAGQYLTRFGTTRVDLDLPAPVTLRLPEEAWYDLWAGDTQIAEGRVLTDRSVTRRTYA